MPVIRLHTKRKQALDLLAAGVSQREAARQAGVSEGGLRRWLAALTPRERLGYQLRRALVAVDAAVSDNTLRGPNGDSNAQDRAREAASTLHAIACELLNEHP